MKIEHTNDCEVIMQRALLDRSLAIHPEDPGLLQARADCYDGGKPEAELCDCGAFRTS